MGKAIGLYVSLALSCLIIIGFVILRFSNGGYRQWVYILLGASLLAANLFQCSRVRKLRVRNIVGAAIIFLAWTLIVYHSGSVIDFSENLVTDMPKITYEYYDENFIWYGKIYKKIVFYPWQGTTVYIYDRQGNLIATNDSDSLDNYLG